MLGAGDQLAAAGQVGGLKAPDPGLGQHCPQKGVFARALGNAIEVCDPSRVALYGQAFLTGRLFDEIASRVESNERPCEIARSGLDPALPALGGAALALDRFFLGRGA